jgi:hypothetical protein
VGFYPFVPIAPGTINGPVTITGLLTTQAGIANSGAAIASSAALTTSGLQPVNSSGNVTAALGSLDIQSAGQGLQVKEGANAKQGTFALAGTATTVVANTSVTASSRILMTCQALGTVAVASTLAVSARTPGTSFTVTPSVAADTSTIAYEIFEPG